MSGQYRLWHDLFLWSQSRLLELHAVSSPQSLAVHRLGAGGRGWIVQEDIQLSS